MPAWVAGWTAHWRALHGAAWLPRAAAIGQWALVATITFAMAVQTAGYLGRLTSPLDIECGLRYRDPERLDCSDLIPDS
jgi:hypothetical protein